jgi:hypothetical protein
MNSIECGHLSSADLGKTVKWSLGEYDRATGTLTAVRHALAHDGTRFTRVSLHGYQAATLRADHIVEVSA